MKKAINLYFYGGETKNKLDAIKSSGYDGVLLGIYTKSETMSIHEQLEYCKQIGLEVSMIHCEYNINHLDHFWLKDDKIGDMVVTDYISQIESFSSYNVPAFVVHLSGSFEPTYSKYGIKRLEKILNICQKNNIKLCIENLEYPKQIEYIFNHLSHPNLSFCYDSGHKNCFSKHSNIATNYSQYLFCTHIHDNHENGDEHLILGHGTTDLNTLAKELSNANNEYLTSEIKYNHSSLSIQEILHQNLQSLVKLEQEIFNIKHSNK